MLTKAQDWKYWSTWGAVVRANEWRMAEGRLHPRARLAESEIHQRVAAFARIIAGRAGQIAEPQITVNDLRHGAHWLALGRDKSHSKFTNQDLDRVLPVFRLLVNPTDLQARMDFDSYQRGEDPGGRKRLLVGIESKAPEAYIAAVALDKFGTKDWRSLNGQQLFRLNMTLDNRRARWNKPVKDREPVAVSDNYPF